MKFGIMTLGCKVNQYESQAIEGLLCRRGHEAAALGDGLDVCVLNTCAVTAESGRKSRQSIRRMKKLEPNALIAVNGCFSQLEPESVAELGVDLVWGTNDRLGFVAEVEELCDIGRTKRTKRSKESKECHLRSSGLFEELPPGSTTNRTRALLKIQDGCNNFCTYCIVPYIRGRSRSLPIGRVAEYARQQGEQGYKEIVVTGIEISSYGKDLGSKTDEPSPCLPCLCLFTAIKTISSNAPNARLRLGSLDPAVLTEEFIRELSEIPNLCSHIHLSLQSGCDETLKRMGRKYTADQVLKSIESIRKHFNQNGEDCGITADIITGFPGETEDEFIQTLEFINKAAFSDMHIFPYSLRPGTKAAKMSGQVPESIRKERASHAIIAAGKMADEFRKKQIGRTLEVLFEKEKSGVCTGHSRNYLQVEVKGKIERNSIKNVEIIAVKNSILTGEKV